MYCISITDHSNSMIVRHTNWPWRWVRKDPRRDQTQWNSSHTQCRSKSSSAALRISLNTYEYIWNTPDMTSTDRCTIFKLFFISFIHAKYMYCPPQLKYSRAWWVLCCSSPNNPETSWVDMCKHTYYFTVLSLQILAPHLFPFLIITAGGNAELVIDTVSKTNFQSNKYTCLCIFTFFHPIYHSALHIKHAH